jgi:hypothetical protein
MDRDGRREIALLGIGPNREYLLSEILRTHGFASRTLSSADDARLWIEGIGSGLPLLIAEADPEGRIPADVIGLRSRFPTLRVLPLPSDFKPSELFSLIGSAVLSRQAIQSAHPRRGHGNAPGTRSRDRSIG